MENNLDTYSTVKVEFTGKRLNSKDRWIYVYLTLPNKDQKVHFANKLTKFDVIGDILECQSNGTVYKDAKKIGRASKESVTLYSIQQQSHIAEKEEIQAAKVLPNGHVKRLIEDVRTGTTYTERRRMALYIYEQLLK